MNQKRAVSERVVCEFCGEPTIVRDMQAGPWCSKHGTVDGKIVTERARQAMNVGDRITLEATISPNCSVLVIVGAGGLNLDMTSVHGETKRHAWLILTPDEAATLARTLLDAAMVARVAELAR